jgi:hypothetical protein
MQISVSSNINKVARQLSREAKTQIPFATASAINNTAFSVRKAVQVQLPKYIDRPTPYTVRGVRVDKAKKTLLQGSVFFIPRVAEYMWYQVEGGTRRASKKWIAVPTGNVKLNKYGNVPRSKKGLIKTNRQFIGKINETTGVWQGGTRAEPRIKLLHKFVKQAQYKRRFPFYKISQGLINSQFDKEFAKAFNRAMATRR